MRPDSSVPPPRPWSKKFRDAFLGIGYGARGQSSFQVHLAVSAAVIAGAAVLRATLVEWCLLLVCITLVLTAEMFNSALECLAKAITDRQDPLIGAALDIASAAVLLASIGAAVVGAVIFVRRLGLVVGWW